MSLETAWLSQGVVGSAVLALAAVVSFLFRYILKRHAEDRDSWAEEHATREKLWDDTLEHERDERERERIQSRDQLAEAARRLDNVNDDLRRLEIDYRERGQNTLSGVSSALTEALRELRRAYRGD